MKNIILFDGKNRDSLLPLTYLKPIGELRVGILTLREKWEHALKGSTSYITEDYLSDKFPIQISDINYVINASVIPSPALCLAIERLDFQEALIKNDMLIAAKLDEEQFRALVDEEDMNDLFGMEVEMDFDMIEHPYDIFSKNDQEIRSDFERLTKNRRSEPLSTSNTVIGDGQIFLEKGARVEACILNTENGPIYIGADATIMEGSLIRGSLALCEHATVKMGAKIYGGTTIGPHCKVGGEISNTVFQAFSNKGHDGFIGNSVIGEWCNLGADTNISNLKNNYDQVKLWSYIKEGFLRTGLQFCGLIMGDHSKCGINTMFNTGTVVGVSANIFGSGYPRNFIPSFSWGGASGFSSFQLEKACKTAEIMMERRAITLDSSDREILKRVFEDSQKFRTWDKSLEKTDAN